MPARRSTKRTTENTGAAEWFAWETVENDDSWLVSYVDLLSILLAALVILLGQMAVTRVAPTLKAKPATTATYAFTATTSLLKAGEAPKKTRQPQPVALDRAAQLAATVSERFGGEINAVPLDQVVSLEVAEALLFDSAEATLRETATSVLVRLARTLEEFGRANITVEGHTDDRAVQNSQFASNWALAAARAHTVTEFLIEQGLAARSLRSVSYADTRPIADNATVTGRAANRRVELLVEFKDPACVVAIPAPSC